MFVIINFNLILIRTLKSDFLIFIQKTIQIISFALSALGYSILHCLRYFFASNIFHSLNVNFQCYTIRSTKYNKRQSFIRILIPYLPAPLPAALQVPALFSESPVSTATPPTVHSSNSLSSRQFSASLPSCSISFSSPHLHTFSTLQSAVACSTLTFDPGTALRSALLTLCSALCHNYLLLLS